jgi:hypothetical protein
LLAFVSEAAGHCNFRPGGAIARAGEIAVFDFLARDYVETQLGGRCRVAGCEPVIENERRIPAGAQEVFLRRNLA